MPRELIYSWTRKDFRRETFRCGGPGGQNQNKRDTGVRFTHFETGLAAESREHRTQGQNQKAAFLKLGEKLRAWVMEQERGRNQEHTRQTKTIRTYHFPRQTVKDHRTKVTLPLEGVLDGNLDPFIEAMMVQQEADRVAHPG